MANKNFNAATKKKRSKSLAHHWVFQKIYYNLYLMLEACHDQFLKTMSTIWIRIISMKAQCDIRHFSFNKIIKTQGIFHLIRTQFFRKTKNHLPPDTHTQVCVSGGK